jgi:hypothetical protein
MACRTMGEFTAKSMLKCPECRADVQVGTGGHRNLEIHRASKACHAECSWQKAWPKPEARLNQTLHSFFKARATPNLPLVSAPPPIHAPRISTEPTVNKNSALTPLDPSPPTDLTNPRGGETEMCAIASELLSRLQRAVERIPSDKPLATVEHWLNEFSNDPSTLVQGPTNDDWEEVLNPMMKRAFGWGDHAMRAAAKDMLHWGQYGLDGFLAFIRYFIMRRGLKGGLIESRVMVILEELETSYMRPQFPEQLVRTYETHRYPIRLEMHKVINVDSDQIDDLASLASEHTIDMSLDMSPVPVVAVGSKMVACGGNLVLFPPGKSQHTSYPFGLHDRLVIPWDYHSINNKFFLQAKTCMKHLVKDGQVCNACKVLKSTALYDGIMHWIKHGVHENTPLHYHGIGGLITTAQRKNEQVQHLRMTKLNNSRKLLGKVAALEDHKQWILAIASGRVNHVALLVQAGLAHRAGI